MVTEQRKHSLSLYGNGGPETKGLFKSVVPPKVEVVADNACCRVDLAMGDIFEWPGKRQRNGTPVGCSVEMPLYRQLNGTVSYVLYVEILSLLRLRGFQTIQHPRSFIFQGHGSFVRWHDATENRTPMA